MVDAPIICPHLLTGDAEWVFICHHEKSKVIVPEIMIKPIIRGDNQKPFELCINILDKR